MRPIDKDILRLAGPSILANISIPLVGMVDMAVAGHLGASATLIGGVTIGSMLFDLLYWNFGFLRAGTGGMTAQAYGRGDGGEEARLLILAVGTGCAAGLVLIAAQWLVVQFAFLFVKCSPQVQALATRYFTLRIFAAPATLSLMGFKGWFIGMQDSVSPMVSDLMVLVLNAAASVCLAFGVRAVGFGGIGFDGIAAGTIIAQYGALLFCLLTVACKYGGIFRGWSARRLKEAFSGSGMRHFFSVNGDLFVRSLCFIFVYTAFTSISARYGDLLLSSSAIIMKIMMFFSYFTDGFAYAGEAMTGRYVGSAQAGMVRLTIRRIFTWSMAVAAVFVVLNALCSVPMIRIFTSDPAIVEVSRPFVAWIVVMPLIGCPAFTWDGIYIGATATKQLRDSSLLFVAVAVVVWLAGTAALNASAGLPLLSFGPEIGPGQPGSYGYSAMHVLFAAYMAHLAVRVAYLTVKRTF